MERAVSHSSSWIQKATAEEWNVRKEDSSCARSTWPITVAYLLLAVRIETVLTFLIMHSRVVRVGAQKVVFGPVNNAISSLRVTLHRDNPFQPVKLEPGRKICANYTVWESFHMKLFHLERIRIKFHPTQLLQTTTTIANTVCTVWS